MDTFDENLVAQHLAKDITAKTVSAHVRNQNPGKALVLSFQGFTGSGKNFVANIVADNVYKFGTKSKFVHKYLAGFHFPHKDKLQVYKDHLRIEIIKKTKACERSLFIFDEAEKMPEGLLDVLKPFLDHHSYIEGIDYSKNIFIFISNTAGDEMNKEVLRHYKTGEARGIITSKQMEKILSAGAYESDGGLKNTNLIDSHLVDFFVPFLPMEREHVKKCVHIELLKRGEQSDEQKINCVADELEYFPEDSQMFSTSGCKKVSKKLELCI